MRVSSFLAALCGALYASLIPVSAQIKSTGLTTDVEWDSHSLYIFGQRVFVLSAEVHPWRVPNPDLWSDIFQKIKANGFNSVSFCVNWALHYPTPDAGGGEGDWQEGSYRDIQRFIDEAKAAGLWLIARPGPYINAETTGGGFPGWVGNIAGSLRTDNVNYTNAWLPYQTSISKILAKNQITNGGPIILVQAENEFTEGAGRSDYMQAVIDTLRANGIVVPLTFNDIHSGQAGNFSPDKGGEGAVDIYCGDTYPQGKSKWAQTQLVYYDYHKAVAPSNPLCLAEFGDGKLMGWESNTIGGTGYEKYTTTLDNNEFEAIFYKDAYGQTATMFNIYMIFGGTNWGQTAEPTIYSSYDYGGALNENRVVTLKMNEVRLQGAFLRVARELTGATLISNGTNYTSTPLIHTAELRNLESSSSFYILRHNDSTSTEVTSTSLSVTTSEGNLEIPRSGNITLTGRDSKILVTDFVFGTNDTSILYSTTEILTWSTIGDRDYLVLYAQPGENGETVLKFDGEPTVDLTEAPAATSSYEDGLLILNYALDGDQYIDIEGNSTFTVVILDKTSAYNWHAPILAGEGDFPNFFSIGSNSSVLVKGPYLVRNASISEDTLRLTGDINGTTSIEFIAPPNVNSLIWNGAPYAATPTTHRSYVAQIKADEAVALPTFGTWKVSGSLPEADPNFDDSELVTADLTATNYTNLPPLSDDVVLYSQQYDFFGGNLIFRGHFNASGTETGFNLTVIGGFAFAYSAFLNGQFLGSGQGDSTVAQVTNVWNVTVDMLKVGEDNILTVIQDHMGLAEASSNGGKEPRGLRGYEILGSNVTFSSWKIQGNQGGARDAPDTFRGYLNEGGLYAERIGAHLPGFDDSSWSSGSPLASEGGGLSGAGVNFYRASFNWTPALNIDIPLRLSITPSDTGVHFRVQIYLNGWQLGKYVNNLGPQTLFVLPPGILRRQSENTLALSLWSLDDEPVGLAGLEFTSDGQFSSALNLLDHKLALDYAPQASLRPVDIAVPPM
ncbi:glycoside hydrolase family 35 protein [Peniophora sp. CONT]|nr:glycoside hydrolase family 35 protein [Peniophora sp. CONT]